MKKTPSNGACPCRFCKRTGVHFVKAHVIARSFFKIVRGKGNYSVGMEVKRRSLKTPYYQAGVADESILCEECEPKFTKWDAYGFDVLSVPRGGADAIASSRDGTHLAIPIENIDYDIFALFLLSVLWRASVSTLPFYRNVDLGPFEEPIREALWNNQAPEPGEYAIMLGTSLNQRYPNVMLRPERCRPDNIHFQRIFFPNCFVHIKADSRPATPIMQLAMIQRRPTNYMFCFPYERSPYVRFFEGMAKTMRENRNPDWLK